MGEKSGKPGPDITYLTDEQRAEFLGLITSGFGINMAVRRMGISWDLFDRTRRKDKGFKKQVDRARVELEEAPRVQLHLASQGGNLDVSKYLDGCTIAAKRFEREMRHKRELLALDREKLAMQAEIEKLRRGQGDEDASDDVDPEDDAFAAFTAYAGGKSGKKGEAPAGPEVLPG